VTNDTPAPANPETYLAVDYGETMDMIRTLTDVRFKLLALVPTVSALGVVVSKDRSVGDAIGISLIGLVATIGLAIYDLRNSQLYSAAMHRGKALEKRMLLRPSNPRPDADPEDPELASGMLAERPMTLRLAGVPIKHDRGLALVYSAAVTGWMYVLASSALALLENGVTTATPRREASATSIAIALGIAAVAGLAIGFVIGVFDRRGDENAKPESAVTAEEAEGHRSPRWVAWLVRSGKESTMSSVEARYYANQPKPTGPARKSARAQPPNGKPEAVSRHRGRNA
jgi:hypothetical protein